MAFLKYFIVGFALCTYTYAHVYGFTNPLLYNRFMEQKRKKNSDTKVEMNVNSTTDNDQLHQKVPMDPIENELSKIEGLDELKMQIRKWLKGMHLDERRRALGLPVGPRTLPQLAFLGNPGTGKTMVARRLSKLLHMVGILPKDKVIQVRRTDCQTGILTRHKIQEAEGGILFVDDDFECEALEEIMSCMDNGKVVVIFAGYTEPMNSLFFSNEGIGTRLSNIFHFDDFSCKQLAKILHLKLSSTDESSRFYGFKLDPNSTSVEEVAALIKTETTAEQRKKMNGRLVDKMLVKATENLDSRIDVECTDEDSMVIITSEDLAVGLRLLRDEENRGNIGDSVMFPFIVILFISSCLSIIIVCSK